MCLLVLKIYGIGGGVHSHRARSHSTNNLKSKVMNDYVLTDERFGVNESELFRANILAELLTLNYVAS